MDITIYKELIELIKNHCQWAIVDDKLYENDESQYNANTPKQSKALFVKFRIGDQTTQHKEAVPIWEWNLERALVILETDNNFKHRVKMHACTPDDADHWLQIAVFGNIIFK